MPLKCIAIPVGSASQLTLLLSMKNTSTLDVSKGELIRKMSRSSAPQLYCLI